MIFFYSNYRKQSFYITTTLFNRFSLLRSEEHTSELQSQSNLVCRLLLEKKKNTKNTVGYSRRKKCSIILMKSLTSMLRGHCDHRSQVTRTLHTDSLALAAARRTTSDAR